MTLFSDMFKLWSMSIINESLLMCISEILWTFHNMDLNYKYSAFQMEKLQSFCNIL